MLLCDTLAEMADYFERPSFFGEVEMNFGIPRELTESSGNLKMQMHASALLGSQIKKSERLILSDPSISAALFATASKPATLASCMEVARFPWKSAWIEWNEGARGDAMRLIGPWHYRDEHFTSMPKKVGLLIQTDEEGRKGMISVAWSGGYSGQEKEIAPFFKIDPKARVRFDDMPSTAIPFMEFDFDRTDFNDAGIGDLESLSNIIVKTMVRDPSKVTESDRDAAKKIACFFCVPYTRALEIVGKENADYLKGPSGSKEIKKMQGYGELGVYQPGMEFNSIISDVYNEILPFIGCTLLFCAKNAISLKDEERGKLNKQRIKSGKPNLLDHQVVYMRLNSADRQSGLGQGSTVERRIHSVRGHFVRRGDSIFWRRQHIRWSNSIAPVVDKITKVTAARPIDTDSFQKMGR
jgi:hypothetical protein